MKDIKKSEAMLERVKRGEWVGRVPYGYEIMSGELYIITDEAQVVRDIYELYHAKSLGIREITRSLNDLGIDRKGYPWHPTCVLRVLKSVVYTGKIRYLGKIYDGNHEPILEKEYILTGDYAKSRLKDVDSEPTDDVDEGHDDQE